MHPVEVYLDGLRKNALASDETSSYPDLRNLLNAWGKQLNPELACIIHPKSIGGGAGLPDGAVFETRTLKKAGEMAGQRAWMLNMLGTANLSIEVKGIDHNLDQLIASEQVKKYLAAHSLLLVTNLWGFALLRRGEDGKPVELERCLLTASPAHFKAELLKHPRKYAQQDGQRLEDFLKRSMLYSAPIAQPDSLAWWLASYAHDALHVMHELAPDALKGIKKAFEDALGLHYNSAKAERFFVSSTVQTLFYGIFSAWVQWHRRQPGRTDSFQWKDTADLLTVPVLTSLFEQLTTRNLRDAQDGALRKILDATQDALNRVAREEFFKQFNEQHAVVYFYEPFLEAFDPELKKELGVWYTPPEIVQYMVERVDRVLREELKLADGLADPAVVILDPCCGTGSFLLEVVRRVHRTLKAKGADGLLASDLVKAVCSRIYGFEILTAPFVISHLQIALLMEKLEAPLQEGDRAAIYLTNALTGWLPPDATEETGTIDLPDLEKERDKADEVKRRDPVLVVIGNPPYNAFAGVSPTEEKGLVEVYKGTYKVPGTSKNKKEIRRNILNDPPPKGWGIKKFNLDDLYIRFFRIADRRITEMNSARRGVICYISNFSYLKSPSFVMMRERYLREFDKIWIDNLNGDSRETGKRTPDGKPDPSVFSTSFNKLGIKVGTAIGLFVSQGPKHSDAQASVEYREFWGSEKNGELLQAVEIGNDYEKSALDRRSRYSLRPFIVAEAFWGWPELPALAAVPPFNGPIERRGMALISIEHQPLVSRIKQYFDSKKSDEEVGNLHPKLMMTGNRIVGSEARQHILKSHKFDQANIIPYPFKPMDLRWCYLDNIRPLFSEPSPDLILQGKIPGNAFLISRDTADKSQEGPPFYFATRICDYDSISGHARHFPLFYRSKPPKPKKSAKGRQEAMLPVDETVNANLSLPARGYLGLLDLPAGDSHPETASLIWYHVLAIGYSQDYLTDHKDGIAGGWPRIPLPATAAAITASATLGRRVAELLDVETEVPGVAGSQGELVKGEPRADVKPIGRLAIDGLDRRLTAGWGSFGQNRTIMPGRGKVTPYIPSPEEAEMLAPLSSATVSGRALKDAGRDARATGKSNFFTIHVNDEVRWECVPRAVWEYTIGGYQVVKKWLSYREFKVLGRALEDHELREVQNMLRRIAALLLLGPELDANYAAVKADTFPWPPS